MNRRVPAIHRLRALAAAVVFAFTTFAVAATPVSLPIPVPDAVRPKPALAAFCGTNAAFVGRLTASSSSTTAVSRIKTGTVYGYISSVSTAWSCTAYYRYSGVAWNTSGATVGRFDWGNLINSTSVACNFVVGSTDYVKANSTTDCPDTDAEYALAATFDAERVYQADASHNGTGDFSFVHSDCGTYYGAEPIQTGQDFAGTTVGNRPGSNCDALTIDSTNTSQTITYDATAPSTSFQAPAATSGTKTGSYTVNFTATDSVSGFGGTSVWTLQRQIATNPSAGTCGTFANDTAAGNKVTGTTSGSGQTSVQSGLVVNKCYRWTLAATDQNGNVATLKTSAAVITDTTAPVATFVTPAPSTSSSQNTTGVTVSWTETETGSGIPASGRALQREKASIVSGACGTTWSADGSAVTTVSPLSQTVTTGFCYRWKQTLTDLATNAGTTATSGTVLVDTTVPTANFTTPDEGTTSMQTSTSYSVAWTESAGAGFTITARSLQRQTGTVVTPGTCAGVTWSNDGSPVTTASPVSATGLTSGAYRWIETLTNSSPKNGATTSGCVIVDTASPTGAITSPATNQPLGGDVSITGTATDAASFLNYQLEYGAGTTPASWTTIGSVSTTQASASELGVWATAGLNGVYTLRLTVRESAGNPNTVVTRTVVLENSGRGDEDFTTRVPFDLGGGYSLDVGVANGEARLGRNLLSIPSYGPPQELGLTYSSLETGSTGKFGAGWLSNLTQYLTFDVAGNIVTWHRSDGGLVPFGLVSSVWTPLAGHHEVFGTGTGVYTITLKDQTKLTFESTGAGRLTKIENRFGKALALVWNTTSATATDASGRATTLTIDSVNNRITAATDSAGRAWGFGYTGTDLTSITDPASKVTTLGYDASHHLTTVSRTRSRVVGSPETITWAVGYTSGRATAVTDPVSTPTATTFTYNAGSTDVVSPIDPGAAYGEPASATTTYAYDDHGRVTTVVDATGLTTARSYDASSNLTDETRPIDASTSFTTTWTYDAAGNVLTETRPIDASTTVTTVNSYNAANDLLTRSDADNDAAVKMVTKYTYDGSGHLTSVDVNCTTTASTPPATASTCTGAGTQDSTTNLITNYAYTANDQLESEQDPLGRVTKHIYDTYGNETSVIADCTTSGTTLPSPFNTCTAAGTHDAQTNVTTSSTYDQLTTAGKAGLATSQTDAVGNVTTMTYDALGRQVTEVKPGDSSVPAVTRTTAYDELGNALTETDAWTPIGGGSAVSRQTVHVYDLANRETSLTDPAGVATTSTYDAAGNAVSTITDGVETDRVFDELGRPLSESVEGNPPTTHTYDGQGNELSTAGADGVETDRTFTDTGWTLTETVDPLGLAQTTTRTYDKLGREITSTDPESTPTTTVIDRTGRTTSVTVAGKTTTTGYDRAGNATSSTDSASVLTTTVYDPLNRPTTVIVNDVASPTLPTEDVTTRTYYDAAGTTIAVTDPKGVTARTIPNVRGLAATAIANCTDSGTTPTANPPACVGAGTKNDVTNVFSATTYDGQGSVVQTIVDSYAVGDLNLKTSTVYDAGGRVQAVQDPQGTITRTFYTGGQVTKTVVNCTNSGTTVPVSGWETCTGAGTQDGTYNLTTTYGYDSAGNKTSETAPNSRVTTYVYDDANRLIRTIANDVASPTLPTEDVTTDYFYDEAGRQAATLAPVPDATARAVTRTVYDDAGRVLQTIVNCTNTGTTLDPDLENPAECAGTGTPNAETNVVTTYVYDAAGNRTKLVEPDPSATTGTSAATVTTRFAYDGANRLCRVVQNSTQSDATWAGLTSPCTDAISGTAMTNVSTKYTYDGAGNVASMIDGNGNTTSYGYDPAGHLTSTTDALGQTVTIGYNDLGQKVRQDNRSHAPSGSSVTWAYDGAGRIATRTISTRSANDGTAPATPSGLSATASGSSRIDLSWTATTDNVGVGRYIIKRDGSFLAQVAGSATSFSDVTVAGSSAYSYTVSAVDVAGNTSPDSSAASATTSAGGLTSYARDTFGRTIASGSGWGTADAGGAWALNSNTSAGVDGSSGYYAPGSSTSKTATFGSISATDVDVTFRTKIGVVPPSGSDSRIDAVGRYVDVNNYYRAEIRMNNGGTITTFITKLVAGTSTNLGSSTTALPTFAAGTWIRVRGQFRGTNPTTIRLRVWADGTPEPATWDRSETDSSAALQVAASAGVRFFPSAGFTFPITLSDDDLSISSISSDVTAPSTPTGVTATANGSAGIDLSWTASTDANGVAGYAIYRGGTYLTTVGGTSWSDTGLTAGTLYSYTVAARDAAGNVSSQSTSASDTTAPASITTSYTYDANGNRLTASDGTLTITATYDRLNRPLTVDDEDPGTTPDTTYTYSLTSPSWTDPTGTYLVSLDKFDRPTSVDGPAIGAITFAYGADGQVLSQAEPNGNTTAYTYDKAGRETVRATTAAGPTSRASLTRTFNRAGQVLTENSQITGDPTNGTTTYTYDPLERLTSAARSGMSTLTYTWDEVPNRLTVQTGAGTPVATTYDAANRPKDQNGVSNVFSSDADGRLTTQPTAAGAAFQRYDWDSLGRLTTVKGATGTGAIATYTYDPLDRLRMVDYGANNRVRFRYVGLTTSVAQTIDDASGLVLRNVGTNWNGERLLDWTGTNANIRYYGTNAHHDTVWTGSSTGTVSATLRYDPFGTLTNSTGGLPDFRYQASWYDATSSLSWVVTRWYAPALGRFLSEDSLLGEPNDPPSRHLYAYGAGEPIARWDPNGQWWYRVRSGDTLWALATRYLGSGTRWREIANLNPATIPHPPTIRAGSCIRIPVSRTNQCLTSGTSVPGAPNYTLYDKVLAYIVHEINVNCCTNRDVGFYDDPWLYTQYSADTVAWINLVTVLDFFYATAPRGVWDHKRPLRDIAGTGSRGFYVPIRGDPVPEIVKYDIWSNIHFGYVGSAHNIPKELILHACTLAGGVSFSDILSCKIGMNLFSKHKYHSWQITKSELQAAVLKALPTYRDYVIHYGETTVRPGYKNWLL